MAYGSAYNEETTERAIAGAAADERERCALLAEQLAKIHEEAARRVRKDGTYTTRAIWPFGKVVECVKPGFEREAAVRGASAQSLRVIAEGCRKGWDPRKLTDNTEKKIHPVQPSHWTPCLRCPDPMECGSWHSCMGGR